jgi:hypothetical protein
VLAEAATGPRASKETDRRVRHEDREEALKEPSPLFVVQFRAVTDEIDETLELATETTRGLIPLGKFLDQIENVGADMEGLCETFQPVLYFLWLMCSRTRWDNSLRHICNLLRRVSDFFTAQFALAIQGSSLTPGDPSNSLEHLEESQTQFSLSVTGRGHNQIHSVVAVRPRYRRLCGAVPSVKNHSMI